MDFHREETVRVKCQEWRADQIARAAFSFAIASAS